MTYAPSQLLTFAAFLAQYRDEPAFELADGELIDRSLTGPHEAVAGKVASKLNRVHPSFVRNQDFIKSKFCRAGILPALGQPRRLSTLN